MAYTDQIDGNNVDRSYAKVVNLGSCRIPYVRSFEIIEGTNEYALKINAHKLIGRYPTIAAALGALIGCFHAVNCNDDFAIQAIENMISNGTGIIPSTGPLQEIAFLFTDVTSGTAIVSSTGEEVINSSKTSQLIYTTSLRLWNGAYTGLSSPYNFPTQTESEAYWAQFKGEAQVNGGPVISLGDPINGGALPKYINLSTALAPGGTWSNGDAVLVTISNAS